jgi:hypothetical protein
MHAVFALWRVHQVHHSDADFDVSTALRVHPLETLFMQGTYLAAVAVLAPPLSAVRLCGTYLDQPAAGHRSMALGFAAHKSTSVAIGSWHTEPIPSRTWLRSHGIPLLVVPIIHRKYAGARRFLRALSAP